MNHDSSNDQDHALRLKLIEWARTGERLFVRTKRDGLLGCTAGRIVTVNKNHILIASTRSLESVIPLACVLDVEVMPGSES